MADQTAYPTALDTLGTLAQEAASTATFATDIVDGTDAGDETPGSTQVNWMSRHFRKFGRALVAVETEMGANPSGTFVDLTTRLNARLTCRKTADETFTTQTNTNVTDMSMAVPANADIAFQFIVMYTAGTARGIGLAVSTPASGVAFSYGVTIYGQSGTDGTGAAFHGTGTASSDAVVSTATPSASTNLIAIIKGILSNGVNAGSLQLQARQGGGSTAANAIVKKGSWGEIYIN